MDLLPQNATALEKAFSLASDPAVRLNLPVTQIRGIKYIGTPTSWLPFLIYEYGLGELSPYVPNLANLIADGVAWQRVRGTPAAASKGLNWLGYTGEIENAPIRRTRWHLFQLALGRVRDAELPDLERIEAVTQLSVPVRSHFWRGFRTYDVRATEHGYTAWGNSIWSAYSGVRLAANRAKWSFGRLYELDNTMTQAQLTALGTWIAPTATGAPQTWEHVKWPHYTWAETGQQTRRDTIINSLAPRTAWVTFLTASNAVIGHRRARVWRRVVAGDQAAPYQVAGSKLAVAGATAAGLYFEAMTDFGDGAGSTAAKWQVRLGATLTDPTQPGLLWATPNQLTGGTVACEKTDTIAFGTTVRERCRAYLRVV
jgi:hypothetical protein